VKQVFKIASKLSSWRKKRAPNDSSSPFKEKEKRGEGGSKAWWPMEGSKLGGQWKVKEKPFSPLPFSPQQPLPKPSIFPFDLTILLYHGPKSLLTPSFPFL
jgi:hypothetical protein